MEKTVKKLNYGQLSDETDLIAQLSSVKPTVIDNMKNLFRLDGYHENQIGNIVYVSSVHNRMIRHLRCLHVNLEYAEDIRIKNECQYLIDGMLSTLN